MGVRAGHSAGGHRQRRIRHLSYSDQGGRPDGVQVMLNRGHLYVGHMFSDGVTILDAADPRAAEAGRISSPPGTNTRTHHLQVADDLLLLANGANIVAMQSYDNLRGYFENTLADSITNRKKFRSGLSIHDISKPARDAARSRSSRCRASASTGCGGPAGATPMSSAHFDGFTDHILCIVDLQNITKPEIVSNWWLPGMNRAGGETSTLTPKGKRVALHHMIAAGNRGYGAWRDGGFTIHDISDPAEPEAAVAHQLVAAVSRRHAHAAAAAGAQARRRRRRGERREMREGHCSTPSSSMCARRRIRCRSRRCRRRRSATSARMGTFGPHNLHENRPGSFQSEETIFATYNNAGVRVFDIKDQFAPKEIASWVPPAPKKLIDPRPNVALAAKTCDIYVTPDGLMYVSDWNAGLHVLQYEG